MFVETCFWKNFADFYRPEVIGLSGIVNFLNSLDPHSSKESDLERWDVFTSSIEVLIRQKWEPNKWMGYIHMGKATMLLHYIEAVIMKFDRDSNGTLDEEEGLSSYVHFQGMLERMARERCHDLDESQLKIVFAFILKYAKVPKGKLNFIWEEVSAQKVETIDHLHMVRIFRQILAANSEGVSDGCVKPNTNDEMGKIMQQADKNARRMEQIMKEDLKKF
jgi:hypothetical protein